MKKLTGAEIIKKVLEYQDIGTHLCIGEIGVQARALFGYKGASDISIARRLYEMENKGIVKSQTRPDCNYKEWEINKEVSCNTPKA